MIGLLEVEEEEENFGVFISNVSVLFLHSRIKVIFKKRVVKKYLLSPVLIERSDLLLL